MVVFIDMLKGPNLKRDLGVRRVIKRWHNKNNSGGNFGINILMNVGDKDYELTGYHNVSGEVYSLTLAPLYRAVGRKIIRPDNYRDMMYKDLIAQIRYNIANPEEWAPGGWG